MKKYSFIAEGRPRSKQRPRMARRGKVFTPKETLEAEAAIAAQYNGPKFDKPVHVEIRYSKDHQAIYIQELDYEPIKALRGDIDNMVKLTLDALNGVAWEDDSLVKSIYTYIDEASND